MKASSSVFRVCQEHEKYLQRMQTVMVDKLPQSSCVLPTISKVFCQLLDKLIVMVQYACIIWQGRKLRDFLEQKFVNNYLT